MTRRRKANSRSPRPPTLYRVVRSDGVVIVAGVSKLTARDVASSLYGKHNELTYLVKPDTGELINIAEYLNGTDTP